MMWAPAGKCYNITIFRPTPVTDIISIRSIVVSLSCLAAVMWAPAGSAQIRLFTSVLPLKHFVERVGGEYVEVESMVQPGHSPATYEPTPRQMAGLASAQAFIRVGVPFESVWMDRIAASNPGLSILDARDGVALIDSRYDSHAPGSTAAGQDGHGHSGMDPHIWLDPAVAKKITAKTRDYLAAEDPAHEMIYHRNADRFLQELDELDTRIRRLVENANSRRFLVFHPAWGYFARAYDLEQLAVEIEGKQPGPRSLARLIELSESGNIGTIFVQKQFSDRMVQSMAAQIDAKVVELDPLAEDYVGNLLSAARAIAGSGNP